MAKKYFDTVDTKVNFPALEEKTLEFWEKNKIFEKSLEKNKDGKTFVFYEGPPTANGKPGIHHVESRSFKDIIPRYKTMRGFNVPRKAGWDCHGLPVELQIEKSLNISGKPQIEEYGIEEFNALCRKSVHDYMDDWTKLTKRIGYWVDTENPYETMDTPYIESEWWILKEIYKKGWLYEDYKVVPYCSRCGTSLSSHELAQGYKDDVEDPSIFVKFKLRNENNTYFLAWTTTPWTLPGNVALAVDAKSDYVKIKVGDEYLIMAAKRAKDLDIKGKIVEKYKGKDLEKIQYEPLYNFVSYDTEAHYVVLGDFVSMDDGTGIVHTAVMYGEEDFKLAEKYGLPKKHVVNEKGEFISDVKPWEGRFVKGVDKEIIEELTLRNLMFRSERIKHTYPFCWRCGTPLLYYAMTSWYLKTTAVKKELIANNNSVNWIPDHIKEGRMGDWLKNNHDWALSRSRYWGTPLPIWRCEKCGVTEIIGSVKELSERAGKDLSKLDLHRPFIDEVIFKCKECDAIMRRVNFVLDCWFDSGAMPMAQWHYPFENKEKFEENFPADYISEAIDQTRGWFYTLQGVSALMEMGTAYKNVICLGHVLDEKGNKMSKSKGNIVDPWEVMNEVGADATRWYFYSVIAPGPSFKFSTNLVKDVTKRFLLILWNSYNYFTTYSNLNNWEPKKNNKPSENILDKWVLVKLQEVINNVTKNLDNYDLYNATHEIEDFVSKDFSQWYIRRSRGRTDGGFFQTSLEVLSTVCKLMAPFAPFMSDEIYMNLVHVSSADKNLIGSNSVHLADWPKVNDLLMEEPSLLSEMDSLRKIAEKAHGLRKEAGISLRQPLGSLSIIPVTFSNELNDLLSDEVNVKEIKHLVKMGNFDITKDIKLDLNITPELKAEGEMRDLVRKIQEARKELGTKLDEMVNLTLEDWPKDFEDEIKKRALVKNISKGNFKVERVN
jgi:isoleucyl-tRNA synthetase